VFVNGFVGVESSDGCPLEVDELGLLRCSHSVDFGELAVEHAVYLAFRQHDGPVGQLLLGCHLRERAERERAEGGRERAGEGGRGRERGGRGEEESSINTGALLSAARRVHHKEPARVVQRRFTAAELFVYTAELYLV